MKAMISLVFAGLAAADLRMASQPKSGWKVQQRSRNVPFQQDYALYMEPSDFNYEGLKKQRDGGGYDNFLRSNIDNEQDRRNFNTEAGRDHLPFRSYETAKNDVGQATVKHKMDASADAGNHINVKVNEAFTMPLRWNNPHSAELEVNIWIMNKGEPYVVPIQKPVCSGEGYQDNVFTFKVPADFNTKASCRKVGECVLQIYAHSVESRMYSMGTPLIVEGGTGAWTTAISEAEVDVGYNLNRLRRLCLPRAGDEADIKTTKVFKARLSSDVYNHAYQNSDFSPYAGQQPLEISQNLQASCILKMATGNFGELGKQYMQKTAPEARQYANKLDKKARALVRVYETVTNSVIEAIKMDQMNNDTLQHIVPANSVECLERRDWYMNVVGGRPHGKDYTGAYCPADHTCLCMGDCYKGYGKDDKERDAYCAKMEYIMKKSGSKDSSGKDIMEESKFMKVVDGTQIDRVGKSPQTTESCFRCAEAGSTTTRRRNTNTYIPSFEIQGETSVETAREYIAPIYLKAGLLTHPDTGAITQKGDTKAILQIYMAVLTEMWPEFQKASSGEYLEEFYKRRYSKLTDKDGKFDQAKFDQFKFTYRGPVLKTTTSTLADERQFIKTNADGKNDRGYYAAMKAWSKQKASTVDIPQTTKGPLENANIRKTSNVAGNYKHAKTSSPAGTLKASMPPPAADSKTCGFVQAGSALTTELTPENKDMDGLNFDADCDDDAAVAKMQAVMDAECAKQQEEDVTYVCPEYPEPECHIPGEGNQLPEQMFTNNLGEFISGVGTVMPSAAVLLGSLLFL